MAISKMSLKQIMDFTWEDISKLNAKESRVYYNRLKKFAKQREARISKAGEYSSALENNLPRGIPAIKRNSSRNEIQHNIASVRSFMESPTSTLTGIKTQRKVTSARIFGVDKKGRPKYTFSGVEEERRFWSAYHEFMNQNPTYLFESNRVRQFLAQETFWKTRDFTQGDLNSLLQNLASSQWRKDWDQEMEDFL